MSINSWSGAAANGAEWHVERGDAASILSQLRPSSFQSCVTSPPYYWQRDYGVDGQIGLEYSIESYVKKIVAVMNGVRRVLKEDGTLFLNLGDTYYSAKGQPKGDDRKSKGRRFGLRAVDAGGLGVPRKTLIGLPWRVALAMIEEGWVLRAPLIWQRPQVLPEPTAKDRPWRTYEFVFLFSKKQKYKFYREQLGGEEDVWRIPLSPNKSKGLHTAAFPEALAAKAIFCASDEGDWILDPFCGTGTTISTALKYNRNSTGIDLSPEYCEFSSQRLGLM